METIQDIETVQKGERILLNNLHFEAGSPVLMDSSRDELNRLLHLLQEHENLEIEISGYLCCGVETRDGDGYDYDHLTWDLSKGRAKKVYDYLVKNGIDNSRLTYLGMGLTNPIVPFDASDKAQVLNRRVEIKIVEK